MVCAQCLRDDFIVLFFLLSSDFKEFVTQGWVSHLCLLFLSGGILIMYSIILQVRSAQLFPLFFCFQEAIFKVYWSVFFSQVQNCLNKTSLRMPYNKSNNNGKHDLIFYFK